MEQNNYYQIDNEEVIKGFMSKVFGWMFAALAITAATAYLCATGSFLSMLINPETGQMSFLYWVVTLAPLALVFIMSGRIDRLSKQQMTSLFIVYSALMGMSLSFIFVVYTTASIVKTFFITSIMFGVMALVGATTKTDLTKFGKIMFMGLIGIIVATLINFFTRSATIDYIVSFIAVLVFTGLTAYDVQKLKKAGGIVVNGDETASKLAIWGALTIYLDFINLFLYLLRFFGRRD